MDDIQLKAALLDLAEYGFVYVDAPNDANQICDAAPVRTRIWPIYYPGRKIYYRVEVVTHGRHKNHCGTRE